MKQLVWLALMTLPLASWGKIYKWTDADGMVHFSDTKPVNQSVEEPYSALSNADSPVTEAEVQRLLPGKWQGTMTEPAGNGDAQYEFDFSSNGELNAVAMISSYGQPVRSAGVGRWSLVGNRLMMQMKVRYLNVDQEFNREHIVMEISQNRVVVMDDAGKRTTLSPMSR